MLATLRLHAVLYGRGAIELQLSVLNPNQNVLVVSMWLLGSARGDPRITLVAPAPKLPHRQVGGVTTCASCWRTAHIAHGD